MGRMNWDKLRRERPLQVDRGPLEPTRESWEPLPSKAKRTAKRRAKGSAASGEVKRTAAPVEGLERTPDGYTPAQTRSREPRAESTKPARREPFVRTAGRAPIDDVFARVRTAQAARAARRDGVGGSRRLGQDRGGQ